MCRPSAAGVHWVMAAPSARTQPLAAGQTPTIARTRDDLPEPRGPAIASALPALRLKLAPRTTGLWAPGGVTLNASIASACAGAGSSSRAAGAGMAENRSSSRRERLLFSHEQEVAGVDHRSVAEGDDLVVAVEAGVDLPLIARADLRERGALRGRAEADELQRIARCRTIADEVHDGVAVGLPGMEHEGVVAGPAG